MAHRVRHFITRTLTYGKVSLVVQTLVTRELRRL